MRSLQGRVAIVTGASRGIGAEIALQLARNGAKVVVNYFGNEAKAEEIAAKINEGEEELRGITLKADVANSSEVCELFDRAEQCFGRVHIVVNNAGVLDSTCSSVADTPLQVWDWTFDVNCKATFLTCKEAARRLVHVEGGRIINITGTLVATLRPGFGAYAASKAAVETFTRVLARELQGTGVTANCVAPGPIATDMFYAVRDEDSVRTIAEAPPLERLGECKDIAPLVAFLASDDEICKRNPKPLVEILNEIPNCSTFQIWIGRIIMFKKWCASRGAPLRVSHYPILVSMRVELGIFFAAQYQLAIRL